MGDNSSGQFKDLRSKGKKKFSSKKNAPDLEVQIFEEEISYKKSILNNILESSIEYSIVGTDIEGIIIVWNEGAHRNYGYQADEVINKENILMLHIPKDVESGVAQEFMEKALKNEKAEGTFERVRKDGTCFIASVTLTLRKDDKSNPIGYVMISKDITKENQLANELIRSNQELEQFAYIVSHDLKAPLRAIQQLACWIEEDNIDKLDDNSKKNLFLLRQRTIRMANFIDGILQYSRAGQIGSNPKIVDTKEILKEIVENLNQDGRFTIQYPDFFPVFKTPKIPLIQVLSNLIGNSIKHHHQKNGTIKINIKSIKSFYLFSIEDDGPGIDPSYFEKIFLMFQTLKPRDEQEATGVGLSIVKKIVEYQGGKITVQSKVGHGTTMSFTWPKTSEQKVNLI